MDKIDINTELRYRVRNRINRTLEILDTWVNLMGSISETGNNTVILLDRNAGPQRLVITIVVELTEEELAAEFNNG